MPKLSPGRTAKDGDGQMRRSVLKRHVGAMEQHQRNKGDLVARILCITYLLFLKKRLEIRLRLGEGRVGRKSKRENDMS